MKLPRILLPVTVLLLLAPGVSAQENCPETLGLQDYVNCRLGAKNIAMEIAAEGQKDANKVANSDGLSGFGGSKLDLAKRFFTLLDLGDLKEEPNGITFSFNPDLFPTLAMQFNPRVIIHNAELYEPLVKEIDKEDGPIPEGMRADLKDKLKKSFGDFDDAELRIVGSWKHQRRTEGASEMADSLFEASDLDDSKPSLDFLADRLGEWTKAIPNLQATASLDSLEDDQKARVKSDIDSFVDQAVRENNAFHQKLTNNQFYALGMLVANDPQLSFDGFYRSRKGAAGPDEWGGTARYEYGLVSYGRYLGWAGRNRLDTKSITTLNSYLDSEQQWIKRQPRVVGLLEFNRIDPFTLDQPEDSLTLNLDRIRRLTGKLTYGQVLASNPGTKFDFEARYDDFSDDATKNNRFVATAIWTQKLTDRLAQVAGGTQLVVSVIYANKPEFRGEVDRDFGMRAGLKWSLDGDGQ